MTFPRSLALLFPLVGSVLAAEPFRPGYHFTTEKNWINDPNGMVYSGGQYHLFYQYNPFGEKWGHMSWGHAVSKDLVSWDELDVAIPEKDGIMAFSGSAVVDWENSSGFGEGGRPPLVAIYTGHREGRQDQRLAYSNDDGRTWTQYAGNPVLDIGMADFRDPKVFFHGASRKWIMAVSLSVEKKVSLYGSENLKDWIHLSDFGPKGALGGIWECPDLFELPVGGNASDTRWVLLLNMNPGAPTGGSGCQYFIGSFDGRTFTLDPDYPGERGDAGQTLRVLADFEGHDFGNWKAEGEAFSGGPAKPSDGGLTGFEGKGLANSFGGSDEAVGTLVSPVVEIDGDWISFLIGGGNHPGELGIRLMVDGKAVRTETGRNASMLQRRHWDVSEFQGRRGRLEIFDNYTGGDWGHITVDGISMGKGTAPGSAAAGLWVDHGADYYAAVTWSDIPKEDGRRFSIGWMSNWQYAENVPTSPWRGAMTLPRELALAKTPDGIRLVQQPVRELGKLRAGSPRVFAGGSLAEAGKWLSSLPEMDRRLEIEIDLAGISKDTEVALSIGTGEDEATLVGHSGGNLYLDRRKSGVTDFHPDFAAAHQAAVSLPGGKLNLRVFLDECSVEVFAADGRVTFTDLVFPSEGGTDLGISGSGAVTVERITVHNLKKAGSGR